MSIRKYCREMSQLQSTQLLTHVKTFHWVFTAVDRDRITSRLIYDKIFCTTLLLKCPSVKLPNLLENHFTFYHSNNLHLWHPESSSLVILLLHADWTMQPIRVEQTSWLLFLSTRNPSRGCWSLRKLHFSKIIWWLALGFSMDLWLNAMRKSINPSVFLVFNLEAGQFKFMGESAWHWSAWKWAFHPWLLITWSKSQCKTHQIHHFEPQKFATSNQFKWKAYFQILLKAWELV